MSPIKLICAVIATKTREIDIKYKEYWLNIIDKVKKTNLDIEFFFLYCDEGLKKMKIDGMDIYMKEYLKDNPPKKIIKNSNF